MDREKLKVIREALIFKSEDMENLGKKNAYFAHFAFLEDILRKIITALLEDNKPKTATEATIMKEAEEEIEKLTRWTPEELQAIKESIIHWRDNVSRLKLADELGIEIIHSPLFAVWLTKVPLGGIPKRIALFTSKECALCGLFFPGCNNCPLSRVGNKCADASSAYRKCGKAQGNQEIISSAENMARVLESLLE